MDTNTPLLWLCGAPGAGKTATAWAIFEQLRDAGVRAAFVDADQLGMCYPQAEDDPQNDRIKAQAFGAVWRTYVEAGAECVILSGSVADADSVREYLAAIEGAAPTVCGIRVAPDRIERRLRARGWGDELIAQARKEVDAIGSGLVTDLIVDPEDRSVAEVARLVRAAASDWPPAATTAAVESAPELTAPTDPRKVLWISGPPCSGKSAVGWELYMRVLGSGATAAFLDIDQLGWFAAPTDVARWNVKARNLSAVWGRFREKGADCLIVVGGAEGREEFDAYAEALAGEQLAACRLKASAETLVERVHARGRGEGPELPGDVLRGKGKAELDEFAERAAIAAKALEAAGVGAMPVDTDGKTAAAIADEIRTATGDLLPIR
jgi:adenylylsulfate kinase-like enzyme